MTIYIGNRDSSASRRGATPLVLGPADSVNSFLSCSGLGKQFNVLLRTGMRAVSMRAASMRAACLRAASMRVASLRAGSLRDASMRAASLRAECERV